jgi:hypothetical protein
MPTKRLLRTGTTLLNLGLGFTMGSSLLCPTSFPVFPGKMTTYDIVAHCMILPMESGGLFKALPINGPRTKKPRPPGTGERGWIERMVLSYGWVATAWRNPLPPKPSEALRRKVWRSHPAVPDATLVTWVTALLKFVRSIEPRTR